MTAGVLHRLGIHMGNKFTAPTNENPLGFFENLDFTTAFCEASGSRDWQEVVISGISDTVFHIPEDRLAKLSAKAVELSVSYQAWGIKDPRLIFPDLLRDFLLCLPDNCEAKLIVPVRPIKRVESSLLNVLGGDKQGAIVRHAVMKMAAKLLDLIAWFPGPVMTIQFDSLIDDTHGEVERIAEFCGIEVHRSAIQRAASFVTPSLRRF